MPTPISHAAVGFAVGAWMNPRPADRRVPIVAAACAALPDIDVLGAPLVAHRAITHSIAFALTAALLVTLIFFRDIQWASLRLRIGMILALALLSHSCLDGLSKYSLGIEFFAPFSTRRYRFPWTPLGAPGGRLAAQLALEACVVFLPAVVLGWLAVKTRGRAATQS